jgi:hypothetical protein
MSKWVCEHKSIINGMNESSRCIRLIQDIIHKQSVSSQQSAVRRVKSSHIIVSSIAYDMCMCMYCE